MMRPSLPHPLREPRHPRRHRARRGARPSEVLREQVEVHRPCDPAVQRVREAGGPLDSASYNCACGCLFSANVSTSVSCPHCGAEQAW
ncbi:MAG TPA: hypothetical protein VGX72_11405 [Solirubrobacteraceae bacterium]|nr:hypothetical protein [Solirubrobacteraceae bacterium]